MKDIILYIVIIALLAVSTLLGIKLRKRGRQLRLFTEQLKEIREERQERLIRVESFDEEIIALAKELQQYVEEEKKLLSEADEERQAVKTMVAGISHDFRTPLTAADGYLQMAGELIQKGNMSREDMEELKNDLKIVSERLRYLRSLSDEFFEVTYLDAKKELPLSEVRFDTVLSEVLLGQYDRMQEKQIEMRMDIPEEQMPVRADRHYLERILENLFSNAAKYAKSYLELRVERTGVKDKTAGMQNKTVNQGVTQEKDIKAPTITLYMRNDVDETFQTDTEHIFEPFYRAKGRSGPGTGLGLYVCKELADAMYFELKGEINEGVFELRLIMPEYYPENRQDPLLCSES